MDKGSQSRLEIGRLSEGGYIVSTRSQHMGEGNYPLYATGSIKKALKFIRHCIETAKPEQGETK